MPWKVRSVMKERLDFIVECLRHEKPFAQVCAEFEISRKTGYKILERFLEQGPEGLEDRSRRPHYCPHQMSPQMEQRLLQVRSEHPTWGARKLLWRLEALGEPGPLPASSTVAGMLKRHGLAAPRKRYRKGLPSLALVAAEAPNDVWATDFKGWFWLGNGQRCDPLTLMDSHSRFLLACRGFYDGFSLEGVKEVFREAFEVRGLPRYILSDNGSPFGSTSAGGLTRLSVWWVRQGILPLRIVPGKPQQNGRLERMHRTLKHETACPPSATPTVQEERFVRFSEQYNYTRPHEALGGAVPGAHYTDARALRPYRGDPPPFDYPDSLPVRQVSATGVILWKSKKIFLSTALAREQVALQLHERLPLATVLLGQYRLCVIDLHKGRLVPASRQIQLLSVNPGGGVAPIEHLIVSPLTVA